eukprot:gene13003-biopygen12480
MRSARTSERPPSQICKAEGSLCGAVGCILMDFKREQKPGGIRGLKGGGSTRGKCRHDPGRACHEDSAEAAARASHQFSAEAAASCPDARCRARGEAVDIAGVDEHARVPPPLPPRRRLRGDGSSRRPPCRDGLRAPRG